jgi:hypothetical protein
MRSIAPVIASALVAATGLLPAAASAKIVELGAPTNGAVGIPQCPSGVSAANCRIVLERTTAVDTVVNGVINPAKVAKAGWIVAFTVGLSNLSSNAQTELGFLKHLNSSYGGPPEVALSVLKPGPKNKYTVVAQSGIYHVTPLLGQVLQEPMSLPPSFTTLTALPVLPGEVIGLSVPTWAPVLSYDLTATKYSYRQSRMRNCTNPAGSQTARIVIGASTRYLCTYPGSRIQYSATEVLNTPYPKTYVGGPSKKKGH